jgi:two-component system OmpR family sensor kinase
VVPERAGDQLERVNQHTLQEHHRFLRRLDHEIKNPLTAIRAGLVNLRDAPGMAHHQDALMDIDGQVMRLGRLLADLRKLAEFETRPIEQMKIDLSDLLQEVLALAEDRPEASERTIKLVLPQAPWPLPLIAGDWDLLFLAIHNLIDNAIKYTLPGNTIEIRAYEHGAAIHVEIADTGPGIPEGELPHVWEELSRGYSARGIPGSGLGLPLVKAIAERHGGQVSLRSRAGYGTVFAMRLPIAAAQHTQRTVAMRSGPSGR